MPKIKKLVFTGVFIFSVERFYSNDPFTSKNGSKTIKALKRGFNLLLLQTKKRAVFICSLCSLNHCFGHLAGSNLLCSNQINNKNPEELKEAEIQRFLADLRAISHFCKVFRVDKE